MLRWKAKVPYYVEGMLGKYFDLRPCVWVRRLIESWPAQSIAITT